MAKVCPKDSSGSFGLEWTERALGFRNFPNGPGFRTQSNRPDEIGLGIGLWTRLPGDPPDGGRIDGIIRGFG